MPDLIADLQLIRDGGHAIQEVAHRLAPAARRAEHALQYVESAVGHPPLRHEVASLLHQLRDTHIQVLDALSHFGAQVCLTAETYAAADNDLAGAAGDLT